MADKISGGISSLFTALSSVTKRIDNLENIKATYGTPDTVIDDDDDEVFSEALDDTI